VILKPLDGMGGTSIFRHRRHPNLSVILETLTLHGSSRSWPGLPAGHQGRRQAHPDDRRRAGGLLPGAHSGQGETRGNLAAGGRGEARPLTEKDRWIAAQVGPTLREKACCSSVWT
jgi:glutathione synthase